ncbi:uncharacterized protein LOC122066011 [Macadamia integrifolia]|uniref:uncharacterized protein LOC122066011 n=1 Tax=Macadamia integrifolia TaxID=60698 RepID=UPI001C4E7015|nr:uncharacterized protein LOC122066011 [Macadamia integrifolia]
MDREPEELQFLGLLGIYKESSKVIFTWRKVFTKITLSLILPLTFIFLAQIQISELIFSKIIKNEVALDGTRSGTPSYDRLTNRISSEWTTFWLFKAAYFIFFLIFSLLSTSAVVYSVASIYTAKELTFKKVMTVVPKVWKRLMITFLWNFIIVFFYNIVAAFFFILALIAIGPGDVRPVVLYVLLVLYFSGLVYISVVWHLASVISVLEDFKGIQAMIKSKALIKGNKWLGCAIFVKLNLAFIFIQFGFEKLVVHGEELGMGSRVLYGMVYFFLLLILFLFGLVVQSVFYFVCKSYHHESIDKSCLADHLEVYLGDYEPLTGKDIQLEQYHV